MLIKIRDGIKVTPDLRGIIEVVNDHYQRHPQAFGDLETRTALETEIAAYLDSYKYAFSGDPFYKFVAELFERHHLRPFSNVTIAFIGGWFKIGEKTHQTTAHALPLLTTFQHFHDIAIHTKGEPLAICNALQMTNGQKVDYVVTGNVLNAPNNYQPNDTILACANLLKKDGRAIHMLGYGEDSHYGFIEDQNFQQFAGQKHLYNIPDGEYHSGGLLRGKATELMMLEQQREVLHAPASTRFYENWRVHHNHGDYYEDYDPTREISTTAGDVRFSLNDYYDYYFHHPERLEAIQGVTPRGLEPITALPRSRDAKAMFLSLSEAYRPVGVTAEKSQPMSEDAITATVAAHNHWRDDMIRAIATEIGSERGPLPRESPNSGLFVDRVTTNGRIIGQGWGVG